MEQYPVPGGNPPGYLEFNGAWSMTSAQRNLFGMSGHDAIGPQGDKDSYQQLYNIGGNFTDKNKAPEWTFAGKRNIYTDEQLEQMVKDKKISELGKNTYNLHIQTMANVQQAKEQKQPDINLGPGQYDIPTTFIMKKGGKVKGGPSKDTKIQYTDLGPNTYEPKFKQTHHVSPQFQFGYKTTFDQVLNPENPGPGEYDHEYDSRMHKTFSTSKHAKNGFGSEKKNLKPIDTKMPGPGNYENIRSLHFKGPEFSMGKSQRQFMNNPNGASVPAPDKYYTTLQAGTKNGYKFGIKQSQKTKDNGVPAPGTYQSEYKYQQKKDVLKPKIDLRQRVQKKLGKYGTQCDPQLEDELRRQNQNIGPQTYNVDQYKQAVHAEKIQELKERQMESRKFQQEKIQNAISTPGAGAYELKPIDSINWQGDKKQKGFHMGIKFKDKKKAQDQTPAPGKYNPEDKDEDGNLLIRINGPCNAIGKAKRDMNASDKNQNIGPASYDIRNKLVNSKNFGTKPVFSLQKRFGDTKSCFEPGPGSYDITTTIGRVPQYLVNKKKTNQLLSFC